MVVQPDAAGRANGFYQLPDAIHPGRNYFLRYRVWPVRQVAAV